MIEHKKQPLPVVAVSISESPDMWQFGLSDDHLRDATAEVALHLLASGVSLAYGGDIRKPEFMQFLYELIGRYRDHPQHNGTIGITDYLAWPVHISMDVNDLVPFSDPYAIVAEFVFLSRTGHRLSQEERLQLPTQEPNEREWAEGLTAMRTVMCEETHAYVALGGKVENYKGVMPGIAEEVCLSLEMCQPTFLIGGFGGCTRDIAETIGLVDLRANSHGDWPGRSRLCQYSVEDLRNGLSREENMVLAQTPHIGEAVGLITHGLRRVFNQGKNNSQGVH